MKIKSVMLLLACVCCTAVATAQQTPRAVSDVVLLDLDGQPAHLPYFGEKHLMIFYIDPDRHKQNEEFTVELERI